MYQSIRLRKGREKSVLAGHPWIFSGAIGDAGNATGGTIVDVHSHNNTFLARGFYNPASQITVRLLTWSEEQRVDQSFWNGLISASVARRPAPDETQTAMRLVHGEADGIPGLVVDLYGSTVVMQTEAFSAVRHLTEITLAIQEVVAPTALYHRPDVGMLKMEGVGKTQAEWIGGHPATGESVTIIEHGHQLLVDVCHGQKTGFFLDQRDNRHHVAALCAGRRVLDCCSYTGAFAVAAVTGGATEVVLVDSNQRALELAEENINLNSVATNPSIRMVRGDAFQVLRQFRDAREQFDVIFLDPPNFIPQRRHVDRGCRGYKDLNMLALRMLTSAGYLATFSCSGHMSADLFQKVVFGAADDSGVNAQIVAWYHQTPDHPVLLTFPESAYLHGLLCRRLT